MEKKKIKNYFLVFILSFMMAIVGMMPFIITGHGFLNLGGDYLVQMVPFNTYGVERIKSGSFGWDWFTGIGTDFIGSYSYYFLGSPFFWIMCLLPVNAVRYAMPFFTAFKIGTGACAAYAYFSRHIKKDIYSALGAILYAFSGYQFFNFVYFFFSDVIALFPLLLLSFDMLVEENKKGFFVFMTALTALTNYFFFFGEVVFIIIYFIVKCVNRDIKFSWKTFLSIAFEAVIGVCISAVLLLPTVLYLSSNSRVSGLIFGVDAVSYSDNTIIPKIFQSLFIGPDCPSRPQLFHSSQNTVNWASVAISVPVFYIVGVAVFIKNNKKSYISKLILISLIFSLIPILNSMFTMLNNTYYARWFYMPIFFICLATAKCLDEDYDLKFGLKIQGAGLCTLFLISFLPDEVIKTADSFEATSKVELFGLVKNSMQFIQNMVLSILFLLLLYAYNEKKKELKDAGKKLLIFSALFIMVFEGIYIDYVRRNLTLLGEPYINYVEKDYDIAPDFDENDAFFRYYNSGPLYCQNNSLYLKIPSISAFHSIASPSVNSFYEEIKGSPRNMQEDFNYKDYPVFGLLSVKYILNLSTNDDLNVEIRAMKNMPGISLSKKHDCYYIYKNENYVPVGNMFEYSITKSRLEEYLKEHFKREDEKEEDPVLEKKKYHYKQLIMLRALVIDDDDSDLMESVLTPIPDEKLDGLDDDTYSSDCSKLASESCSEFSYDENGYKAHISAKRDGIVYFSVPFSKGFSASVNGKKTDISAVHYGMTGIPVSSGENDIVVTYTTPGLREGVMITFSGLAVLVVYLIISFAAEKKRNNS